MDLNDLFNETDDAEKFTPSLNAELAGTITGTKEAPSKYGTGKVTIITIKQSVPDAEGHLYRALFVNKAVGKALALGARKSGMTKIRPGDIVSLRVVDGEEFEPTKWRYSYEAEVFEGDREAYAEPADAYEDAVRAFNGGGN